MLQSPMDHVAVAQINQSTRRMRLALITAIVNVQDKQTVEGSVGDTMWNMTNISGLFMSFKILFNKIKYIICTNIFYCKEVIM